MAQMEVEDGDDEIKAVNPPLPDDLSAKALEDAIAAIFAGSFDADSQTCLVTLMKILDNVLQHPEYLNNGVDGNSKYSKVRTLRLANKAFARTVGSRPGGIDFLLAAGFERRQPPPPLLSEPNNNTAAATTALLVLTKERENQPHLLAARQLLKDKAVTVLRCKPGDLPIYKPPPPMPAASASASAPSTSNAHAGGTSAGGDQPSRSLSGSQFDVYRGHRFNGNSQPAPDARYVSPSEAALQKLQNRQQRLEKKLQPKGFAGREDRAWHAARPAESAAAAASLARFASESSSSSKKGDASLLAGNAQRKLAAAKERDEGNFTTQAMRDLKRMKNQKVYAHCAVQLQFPDGCKLTAKFLPKETIDQVKAAVRDDCLSLLTPPPEADYFDLYVTPPRRLLAGTRTLQQEGLVPAAKLFVSWKKSAPQVCRGGGGSGVGSYLRSDLFLDATGHSSGKAPATAATAAAAFPASRPVQAGPKAAPANAAAAAGGNSRNNQKKSGKTKEELLLQRMMGRK